MKTITLEMVADGSRLANMCQTYGWNESGSRCPLGYEFSCPFQCQCEDVTKEMWNELAEEDA